MRGIYWLFAIGPAFAAGDIPAEGTAREVFEIPANFVHYLQGAVFLDGKPVPDLRPGVTVSRFPEWTPGAHLRTDTGLVEVMLDPGVVFRMAEHSEARMPEPARGQTNVELLSGAAVVEVLNARNAPTLRGGGLQVHLKKEGWYRISADPGELRVFDGAAEVVRDGSRKTVTSAQGISGSDPLVRWAARRSRILAAASAASARSVQEGGIPFRAAEWWWNRAYGSITFLPAKGTACGWSGACYYSPASSAKRRSFQPVAAPPATGITITR